MRRSILATRSHVNRLARHLPGSNPSIIEASPTMLELQPVEAASILGRRVDACQFLHIVKDVLHHSDHWSRHFEAT